MNVLSKNNYSELFLLVFLHLGQGLAGQIKTVDLRIRFIIIIIFFLSTRSEDIACNRLVIP